jgi:DNA-binding response OmpR family regulator
MPERPKVLVLDDSALALDLVKSALEDAGMTVSCANDLASFEALREAAPPDVILMDVQMPEVFGDDLAGMLRGAYGVKVPILLLSNLDEAELERRAKEAAVDGFVSKRAGMPALVARVRSALGTEAP